MLMPRVMCDGCKKEIEQQILLGGFYRGPQGHVTNHNMSLEWVGISELSNASLMENWPIHFHGFDCAMRFYGPKIGEPPVPDPIAPRG